MSHTGGVFDSSPEYQKELGVLASMGMCRQGLMATEPVPTTQSAGIPLGTRPYLDIPSMQTLQDSSSPQQTPLDFSGSEYKKRACPSPAPLPQKAKRRMRITYTEEQIATLEGLFRTCNYPTKETRNQLSKSLGVPDENLKVWFQNRRTRQRKRAPRLPTPPREHHIIPAAKQPASVAKQPSSVTTSPSDQRVPMPTHTMMHHAGMAPPSGSPQFWAGPPAYQSATRNFHQDMNHQQHYSASSDITYRTSGSETSNHSDSGFGRESSPTNFLPPFAMSSPFSSYPPQHHQYQGGMNPWGQSVQFDHFASNLAYYPQPYSFGQSYSSIPTAPPAADQGYSMNYEHLPWVSRRSPDATYGGLLQVCAPVSPVHSSNDSVSPSSNAIPLSGYCPILGARRSLTPEQALSVQPLSGATYGALSNRSSTPKGQTATGIIKVTNPFDDTAMRLSDISGDNTSLDNVVPSYSSSNSCSLSEISGVSSESSPVRS